MAGYDTTALRVQHAGSACREFTYDTVDADATVAGAGYFTDGVNVHGMAIGDRVTVRVWGTAVPALTKAGRNAATLTKAGSAHVSAISTNAATIVFDTFS